MTPRNLMIFGGVLGIVVVFLGAVTNRPELYGLAFGFGAMFGKGYGVHEERSK